MMGFVYFAYSTEKNATKIGFSRNDAGRRMKRLSQDAKCEIELLGTIESDDARTLERKLHVIFSTYYLHGEWFSIGRDTVATLIQNKWVVTLNVYEAMEQLLGLGILESLEINHSIPMLTNPLILCERCGNMVTQTYYKRHLAWNCHIAGTPLPIQYRISHTSKWQVADYQGA